MIYCIRASLLQDYVTLFSNNTGTSKSRDLKDVPTVSHANSSNAPTSDIEKLLFSTLTASVLAETKVENESTSDIYQKFADTIGVSGADGITKNDLTSHLKNLIATDTSNLDNSEQIAAMTNVIANFNNLSAGSDRITPETLSSSVSVVA